MPLQIAPRFEGRSFSFQDRSGQPIVVVVDNDGFLFRQAEQDQVVLDGDGNRLEAIEVAHPHIGEPALQYFAFEDGDIPGEYKGLSVDVDGTEAVPARYVRGVHTVKALVPLEGEAAEDLLSDTTFGPFIRVVGEEDVEESSEEE